MVDCIESLAGPLYLVAGLLVATPALDFVSGVLPLRTENIEWRFATVGLLSGFLLTPVLGLLLALGVAAATGRALLVRAISLLNLAIGALFLLLLGAFLLDIVQLRSAVTAEARAAFEGAAWKAAIKHFCFVVAMAWLGIRGLRSVRSERRPIRRPTAVVIGG